MKFNGPQVTRFATVAGLLALSACNTPQAGPWEHASSYRGSSPAESQPRQLAGTFEGPGATGRFVLERGPGGAWRCELPGRSETSDGSRVWVEREEGTGAWLELGDALVRQGEIELAFGSWSEPQSPWRARTQGEGQVELLRGWAGPRAVLANQAGPGAGAPGRTRVVLRPGPSVLHFPSGPAAPPGPSEMTGAGGSERWTFESSSALPPDSGDWTLGAPSTRSPGPVQPPIEVPLETSPAGFLLVRPRLDGRDVGPFLFDTAASVSCIDLAVARQLDWQDLGEIRVQGVGGKGTGRWLLSGTVELAGLRRSGKRMIELDLAGLSAFRGTILGGLLGADWLRGYVVVVDQRRGRIVFHDRASPLHREWPWQPVLVEGGAPCAELRCAPSGRGWFRLDTGSNDSVTVQSTELRRALYPLRAAFLELDTMRLGGIGGAAEAKRGELPWIELGERRWTEVPASFVTDTEGPLTSPFLVGTLGTGLLRHQPYAIDMDGQRIAFLPVESPGKAGLAGEGADS